MKATRHHEQGHVEICREGVERIRKAIDRASRKVSEKVGRTCKPVCKAAWDEVRGVVQAAYRVEFKRLEQKQVHYDEVTKHGQTQGGIIAACR